MSNATTIFDFSSFQAALKKDEARFQETVQQAAADVTSDPMQAAALRAGFENAIGTLERESRGKHAVMATAQNAIASRIQTYMCARALAESDPATDMVTTASGAQEAKFDNLDVLGWLKTGLKIAAAVDKHPWIAPAPNPVEIGNKIRVALFADWATGLYGAPRIRESINRENEGFQLVMHLGDTYYSGSEQEINDRCIGMFPDPSGTVRRSLNGNHEMYSGGVGYFDKVLPFLKQDASCFAFQNDNWMFVGLDTSYVDFDMDPAQVAWLRQLLGSTGSRKVILFSHHQPFSQKDSPGPKLVASLGNILTDGRIYAWFWGHEHRCVIYDPHPVWGLRGRCIGHGGFPSFRDKFSSGNSGTYEWKILPALATAPGCCILDGPNIFIPESPARYSPHGYVVLEIDGQSCREIYKTADGVGLLGEAL